MTKRNFKKQFLNAVNEGCYEKIKNSLTKVKDVNLPLTVKKETALHLAVIQNDLNLIKFLLDLGADLNSTTNKSETVLILAVDNNNPAKAKAKKDAHFTQCNEDIVKFLLSQSLDVNIQDFYGHNALHVAVMTGNKNYVDLLLKAKIDVNATMKNGSTALHCVMTDSITNTKRMSIVESLIESGIQVNVQNRLGYTALYLAVQLNNVYLTSYLISKGADVNCQTNKKYTAMFVAVKNCNLRIMRLLLKNGADINVKNNDENNLLHYALIKVKKGEKRVNLVKWLLKNGIDVNARDQFMETAIFKAIAFNDGDVINLLLKHGADVNVVCSYRLTPLHIAAKLNMLTWVQVLLNHGAVVNEDSPDYPKDAEPMISQAVGTQSYAIVCLLLHQGSDKHKSSTHSRTPLNDCIFYGYNKVADLLMKYGTDVNLKDQYGDTALHIAVEKLLERSPYADFEILKNLLTLGASVELENRQGHTPLTMIVNSPFYNNYQPSEPGYTLLKHIAVMNEMSYIVGLKNFRAILRNNDWCNKFQQFREEVNSMRTMRIGNSNVFYTDMLVAELDELVKYAQNIEVANVMESGRFRTLFNDYNCTCLMINFTKGQIRLNLLQEAKEKLNELWPVELPEEVTAYICQFLTSRDLQAIANIKIITKHQIQPVQSCMKLRKKKRNV